MPSVIQESQLYNNPCVRFKQNKKINDNNVEQQERRRRLSHKYNQKDNSIEWKKWNNKWKKIPVQIAKKVKRLIVVLE